MTDTVVVIGSGPSPSGISGGEIDRHPVVRMWDHDWQPAERYGSRYDYGLITNERNPLRASRRPDKWWFFYNVPHLPPVTSFDGVPVVEMDHATWYRKAIAHGAAPGHPRRALKFTRGFAAVAGVIDHLRPKRVIVIGMDILRNGFTGSRYYDPAALPFYIRAYPNMARGIPKWAAEQMPAGVRADGPHDYYAESKVIRDLSAEAGVEIVWECAQ